MMSGLTNFLNALEFNLNQRSIKEYSTWDIWPVARDEIKDASGSLLDNAPNYVGSWMHYPNEII